VPIFSIEAKTTSPAEANSPLVLTFPIGTSSALNRSVVALLVEKGYIR
jgi:hypothetical protein